MRTESFNEELLVPSYPTSPKPRRVPMSSLSTNHRSYSRMSSKGIFGDESPLLLSPLPKYPNRRRSVTFADETEATIREERPCYTVWEACSTSKGRQAESPVKCFPTKNTSDINNGINATAAYQYNDTSSGPPAASNLKSPTPKRCRSNSRQRRVARRKEAEMHFGFYDDSVVEEYVLQARKELESEEERLSLEKKLKQQEVEKAEAENRAVEASLKINALQQAKEYLLSTANARRSSPVCSSSERRDDSSFSRSRYRNSKKEIDLIQKNDEYDTLDDEVPLNISKKSINQSMPLVTRAEESERNISKKRTRNISSKKGSLSIPVVQETHIKNFDDSSSENDTHKNHYDNEKDEPEFLIRKKAKLERIISRVIEEQEKRRHGKRSVVVIDWDCADSDSIVTDEVEEKLVSQGRKASSMKSTIEVAEPPLPPHPQQPQTQRRKPQVSTRSVTVRAPSTRHRNPSRSVAPDLGEDSLLMEEDQPVLLRRPATTTTAASKRRAITRSISNVSSEPADDEIFEQHRDLSRKPPRRAPATKISQQRRRVSHTNTVAPAPVVAASISPSTSPALAPSARQFASTHYDSQVNTTADNLFVAAPPPPLQTLMTTRSRRGSAAATKPPTPQFAADDPMAVFFGASFPSPSKFEEMMLAAGGVPEPRRTGRGQQRQPALILPETISRRR